MTDDTLPMTDEDREVENFKVWASERGLDIAHAYDSERSRWVFWNPMTADLWDAWKARASLASPAAPHPAQQAGDMVMVPRVPTEEMMYRGGEATSGLVDWGADSFPDDAPGNLASAVYAAMLAAAPAIPAQQAGQPEDAEDAARYRWLRDRIDPREVREFFSLRGHNVDPAVSLATDAAIDRAMSSPTAKKGEGE